MPLEGELKDKLEKFINGMKLDVPPCMDCCAPFLTTIPHCWWCKAAEGAKNDGENNICNAPCGRALLRTTQDLVCATYMLESGCVATKSCYVPPTIFESAGLQCERSRFLQSYSKVVVRVLHLPFGEEGKKKGKAKKTREAGKPTCCCRGTCPKPNE